jgi:anaerobic selenocysteine-containing dehydrogenase
LTLIQSSEQLDKADRGAGRREALAALEFYAHADLFMNPTAEMADLVLLVASLFELSRSASTSVPKRNHWSNCNNQSFRRAVMPFGYTDRVRSRVSPALGRFFLGR